MTVRIDGNSRRPLVEASNGSVVILGSHNVAVSSMAVNQVNSNVNETGPYATTMSVSSVYVANGGDTVAAAARVYSATSSRRRSTTYMESYVATSDAAGRRRATYFTGTPQAGARPFSERPQQDVQQTFTEAPSQERQRRGYPQRAVARASDDEIEVLVTPGTVQVTAGSDLPATFNNGEVPTSAHALAAPAFNNLPFQSGAALLARHANSSGNRSERASRVKDDSFIRAGLLASTLAVGYLMAGFTGLIAQGVTLGFQFLAERRVVSLAKQLEGLTTPAKVERRGSVSSMPKSMFQQMGLLAIRSIVILSFAYPILKLVLRTSSAISLPFGLFAKMASFSVVAWHLSELRQPTAHALE